MTYGSLFSGIGGLDLGLDRAGFECRWQCELEPFARRILDKHWPGVPKYEDITKLKGSEVEKVDLLCGGFPCQDLSQAGKRAGIKGSRSGLWFEFARLIGELRPRYVLIENVPGLLVYDGMRRVLGELSRRGYDAVWFCLRAADFGASHLRKRVFIVAYARCEHEQLQQWRDGAQHPRGGGDLANTQHSSRCAEQFSGTGERSDRAAVHGRQFTQPSELFGMPFAPGPSDPRWPVILAERPDLAPALESKICQLADGISRGLDRAMKDRTKRLSRLGNAVVSQIAEWIGLRILDHARSANAGSRSVRTAEESANIKK